MIAKAEKWAKEHDGATVDDFLLRCIYGEQEPGWKMTMRDRITCAKIWKEYTMARTSEQTVTHKGEAGPEIGLPPTKADPAKIIPIKGGKKDG
jgi:hypothetical protein